MLPQAAAPPAVIPFCHTTGWLTEDVKDSEGGGIPFYSPGKFSSATGSDAAFPATEG